MIKISHHAIVRYCQRVIGMDEVASESITTKQYNAIRNLLTDKLSRLNVTKAIIKCHDWDVRLVIVDSVLVTITKY